MDKTKPTEVGFEWLTEPPCSQPTPVTPAGLHPSAEQARPAMLDGCSPLEGHPRGERDWVDPTAKPFYLRAEACRVSEQLA